MKTVPVEKILTGDALAWFTSFTTDAVHSPTARAFNEAEGWPVPGLPEGCRVEARKNKGPRVVVPADADERTALDAAGAFLTAMGAFDKHPLSGSEIFALCETGRKALDGKAAEYRETPEKVLREFVMDLVAGTVVTNLAVPPDLVSMVFMPIVFGALDFSSEIAQTLAGRLPPDPGDEPERTQRPSIPELKTVPGEPPKLPDPVQPNEARLAELRTLVSWQRATQADIDALVEQAQKQTEANNQKWAEQVEAWERKKAEVEAANAETVRAHDAAVAKWVDDEKVFNVRHAEWAKASVRHRIAWAAARREWHKNLGVMWESFSKAGPQAINGFPMFFSMRFMNVADWKKAHKAALKEFRRREKVEVA